MNVFTGNFEYTTLGIPHRLVRAITSWIIIPLCICTDLLVAYTQKIDNYPVLETSFPQKHFYSLKSKRSMNGQEISSLKFNSNDWLICQGLSLVLLIVNTIAIYQWHIGKRIKTLQLDQKISDLSKMRVISALIVCTFSPGLAYLLNRSEEPHTLMAFDSPAAYFFLTSCGII